MNLWNAKCGYPDCSRTRRLIIENGEPRCPHHTAAAIAALPIPKAKPTAEDEEAKALAWWESVRLAEKPRHVVVSRRSRPWSMCLLCREPTESGLPEKDPKKRYCRYHQPDRVAIFQAEMAEGHRAKSICVFNIRKHKPCVRRRIVACPEVCAISRLAECMQSTTVCFDVGRRWAVTRVRCLVRFRKHGAAEGVKPQAARTEHGAPGPSTPPG